MNPLPIDLVLKTVTTKVSAKSWERAKALQEKYEMRLSDILSVALNELDEGKLASVKAEQDAALSKLSKPARNLLKDLDKITDDERAWLRDQLS